MKKLLLKKQISKSNDWILSDVVVFKTVDGVFKKENLENLKFNLSMIMKKLQAYLKIQIPYLF